MAGADLDEAIRVAMREAAEQQEAVGQPPEATAAESIDGYAFTRPRLVVDMVAQCGTCQALTPDVEGHVRWHQSHARFHVGHPG